MKKLIVNIKNLIVCILFASIVILHISLSETKKARPKCNFNGNSYLYRDTGSALLAISVDAFDLMYDILTNEDGKGYYLLLLSGHVLEIDNYTKIRILKSKIFSGKTKVRILEGKHKYTTGWVYNGAIRYR